MTRLNGGTDLIGLILVKNLTAGSFFAAGSSDILLQRQCQ